MKTMSLAQANKILTESTTKMRGCSVVEQLDVGSNEQVVERIFGNYIAAALAKIEQELGESFADPKEAADFADSAMRYMRTRGRPYLMKAVKNFVRKGGERTGQQLRRSI